MVGAEAVLQKARLGENLALLVVHTDAAVRARACNLVGNLCRHSDWFYKVKTIHVFANESTCVL